MQFVQLSRRIAQDVLLAALICLAAFGPFLSDLRGDLCFLAWLTCSCMISTLHRHFRFVLPVYWHCTTLAVLVIPFAYPNGYPNGYPNVLTNGPLLVVLRSIHVGLLTSRGGYATDLQLFRSNAKLTAALTVGGLVLDVSLTYGSMKVFVGFSTLRSGLMAAIAPAPSGEVALPLFESMTSNCERALTDLKVGPDHADDDATTIQRRLRLEQLGSEFTSALDTFKASSLPTVFITIWAFSSVASGINADRWQSTSSPSTLSPSTSSPSTSSSLVVSPPETMAINALIGVTVSLAFGVLTYVLGRLSVSEVTSSASKALLVFCTGFFSMYYVASIAPVAPAMSAIVATICLRLAFGPDSETLSMLSTGWPIVSILYYSTFVYAVLGYFSTNINILTLETLCRTALASLLTFAVKFVSLALVTRSFRTTWPSSFLLALSLCSKGTVQIALSVLLPLKTELTESGSFVEEALVLQMFVLINYVVVLPCIYLLTKVIAISIRN